MTASSEVLPLKRSGVIFLLPIFGIAVALIIFEAAVRLIGANKQLIWSDRPGFYYAHSDAPTMQDYPFPMPKPAGEFRIAVIGDSFSFGTAMQVDSTFAKKLERLLQRSVLPNARVINYGVPGYDAGHEVTMTARALGHGADLVIHQITLNDPQKKEIAPTGLQIRNEFQAPELQGATGWLADRSQLFGYVLQRLHNTETQKKYVKFYHDLFQNEHTWDYFRVATNKIHRQVRRTRRKSIGLLFPVFGLPLNDSYPFSSIHRKIASHLEKKKVPYLDLFETYRDIPLERIQVIPGVDFHPNEMGHRLAAEALYIFLTSNELIPFVEGAQPFEQIRLKDCCTGVVGRSDRTGKHRLQ